HGSGYWYVQNDALRANGFNNNAGAIPRQPFKQHNYGYSFGGPAWIPKVYKGTNRTFFFNNLEHTRVRDFRSTSFSTLPVKDFKNGDFSRLFDSRFTGLASSGAMAGADALGRSVRFGAIYDPSTTRTVNGQTLRDIFPNNIVPKSRWSPVSSKILDVGITDPLFDTMLNNIPAIGTCCPFFDETMATVKVDHVFTTAHRISALANRNFRARNNSPGGRWGVPPEKPTDVYQNQDTPGLMYRLAHDWTVRPTVLNHFAMGYNRFGNLNESVYVDQDWPSKVGLQNVAGTHFPRLNFTSGQPHQGSGIGAGGQLGSSSRGGSYNGSTIAQDDVTIIRGKHNYKVGFENRAYYQNSRGKSGSGDFNFSPIQTEQIGFRNETGHAFASFLLGAVQSTSRGITAANFGHRWRQTGLYFVDDWKTTRKLTLNLGFRWETVGGEYEVAARMSALGIGTPNPGAGGRLGALVFAEDLGRQGFMDRNWKQLSPKFGFAYAFSEKLVMRGGYGVNSSPPVSNFGSLGGTLGFNGSISRNSGNTQLRFAEDPVMFLHERYPDFTSTLPNKNPALANGQGIDYVSPNASRLPYVQNWSLGFQFQLPASFVLETNYIGNKGTRLRAAGYDSMNALPVGVLARGNSLGDPWTATSGVPLPYPGFTGSVFQALKPYPQFTGVGQAFPYLGTSNYNALQVQATRHWRKGLAILAAYTWSKSTGLTDDAINSESIADVFNRGLEKAVTNYHYPSFFKLTWIYDLPIGPNKFIHVPGVLGKIVGGWNLSGIHNARSGDPLSIGGGPISSPIGTARMDLVTGQPIITNSDAAISFRGFAGGQTYLNKAAFAPPPVSPGGRNYITRLGTLGPVLPNIRGPMFHSHDIGVQKQYRWTETRVWELRANFTNIINRAGRGNPVTNWASPFFGQITGAQVGGRNIEMSTRFVF
ncbi:MAG: hypothetical protein HY013_00935, partial [Candidatus Solibacter usitatus]|nr:hypothetical protein [Candidatus Solibacter usitatus]